MSTTLLAAQEDPGAQGTDLSGHRAAGPEKLTGSEGGFCYLASITGC